jgi:hypothetical protein
VYNLPTINIFIVKNGCIIEHRFVIVEHRVLVLMMFFFNMICFAKCTVITLRASPSRVNDLPEMKQQITIGLNGTQVNN